METKQYYPSNSPESYMKLRDGDKPLISENCEQLLNKMNVKYGGTLEVGHLFLYKTDGLVFLPNNLAVFQTYEDDFKNLKNPFTMRRWNNNYKWKPNDHLTIDFKVEFIKDINNGKLAYKYYNNKTYIGVNLISAVHQNNIDNNKLNHYLLNSGLTIKNIPQDFKFFATDPFIGSYDSEGNEQNNMGEAYFEVDSKNDNIICMNGDFITNGVTCECSYNLHIKEQQLRWIPHRVRADKLNKPNGYGTAVTTWYLINNPITKEQLMLEKKYVDKLKLNKEANLEEIAYYSSNQNTEYLTEPLKLFTSFVKDYLINRGLSGYVKPKVFDFAVGRLGDMFKYSNYGVDILIGIDINEASINNAVDGAATRMMQKASVMHNILRLADKTMLIVGNTTKNIANGDCTRDNINKYYIDVLYGRAKGNTPKLKKMEGVGNSGFDMISCMYAIHYMMNNESELDMFLRNVSENLLDHGHFIGTCLNGDTILSEMGSSNELQGIIDNKTVFLIKKQNTVQIDMKTGAKIDMYETITVGNKIDVFFETFSSVITENLVSMQYLKEKAKKHNLKLIDYKSFLEEPGNLLSMYKSFNIKNQYQTDLIRKTKALMTWAKFNCYFIFQKVRKTDK